MEWALKLLTAPVNEPVSLPEAKNHLRVTCSADDDLISSLITAATNMVESYTRRQLITATWAMYFDRFESEISLLKNQLQEVSKIEYIASEDGVLTLLDSTQYIVDNISAPARITPAYQGSWPSVQNRINSVVITFIAGYGDNAADVPKALISAILLTIGHLYENRADVSQEKAYNLPKGVFYIMDPYRVM